MILQTNQNTRLAAGFVTIVGVIGSGLEATCLVEAPERMCARVFKKIRPRTPLPGIEVRFCAFANANSFIRMEADRIELRITDVLEGAPGPVLESLVVILISKLYRKLAPPEHSHRYRRYLNRSDIRATLESIRQKRGRKPIAPPRGQVHDLDAIFDDLNFRYFHGLMAQPAIGWSLRVSRATLGHYDPAHHVIVLNKLLDRPAVAKLAVEYVMFHEMLHLRHPVEHNGARRCVHTREFKQEEKRFEHLAEAKTLLKRL